MKKQGIANKDELDPIAPGIEGRSPIKEDVVLLIDIDGCAGSMVGSRS